MIDDDWLGDVARETGRPRHVVQLVLDLMMEASNDYRFVLSVKGDDLMVVNMSAKEDHQLPPHLAAEIDRHIDDVFDLMPAISRAIDRAVVGMLLQ